MDPSHFTIFPNPSDGLIFLSLSDDALKKSSFVVEVFDVLGQLVLPAGGNEVSFIDANTLFIDLRKQKSGVYFIQISQGFEKQVEKIFIKKLE
jgi:hypothetical protein